LSATLFKVFPLCTYALFKVATKWLFSNSCTQFVPTHPIFGNIFSKENMKGSPALYNLKVLVKVYIIKLSPSGKAAKELPKASGKTVEPASFPGSGIQLGIKSASSYISDHITL